MTEIALHILDIANNSTRAEASDVDVAIDADSAKDTLTVTVADDGKGMSEELLSRVTDPFSTTRTTRKVGLGIPLFKQAAELTGGSLKIRSGIGKGTTVTAVFGLSHIDRVPLGDVGATMATLIGGAPETDFTLSFSSDGKSYRFSTKEVKEMLDGVPIESMEVLSYIKEMIDENIENIIGGQPICKLWRNYRLSATE